MKLPLTRPPTSPVEQSRRAKIFSMPKLAAVEGQRQYRCNTPNAPPSRIERSIDIEATRTLDPLFGSPPQSPSGGSPSKPRVVVSEKYSWNPECINSVSGFEWWWRSLPQNHASLEPTQKLKMVTKAAVRLHSQGDIHRAIELYQLALSSEPNDEVKFRLRINLACAHEAAEDVPSSIEEFRLALELNPDDLYAIFKLGCALTAVREFDEARMLFESIQAEYPKAADGLKTLEKAIAEVKQEEEARRAAVAAAKARRSPPKIVSPRVYNTTPREPVAPSTPVVQPPAPRRKKAPAAKQSVPSAEPSDKAEPSEHNAQANTTLPQRPETATVATLTDDELSSPSLLELLVRRCQEARINMFEVMQRLDPQQRGLVHRESFINLLRVIVGANMPPLDDDTARNALNISPCDWSSQENQIFFNYSGFLRAYAAQHQVEAALLTSGEVVQVKLMIDDLIRHDMAYISHHSVSEWMRLGSERASEELYRTTFLADSASRGGQAMEPTPRKQSMLGNSTSGTWSAPDLQASEEDLITPRTRVRKDRAREEWLLTAEKARVLARRQQHCMKSLRDIAARARAHIVFRRNAMAFLQVVAQHAQEELEARRERCLSARQNEAPTQTLSTQDERAEPHPEALPPQPVSESHETAREVSVDVVKELSEQTYELSVQTAISRLQQNTELDDVKAIASRFAAFCQVPPYFLNSQASLPEGGELPSSAEVAG
ncbi:unnamed protein product [Phytophthora lilii]|uniref:Unnamed protein product n=1 Tax=Phytophthora lilii TaxID=2077276 RepID=A0A9W6U246_9STRA|nr:unnamed protein product [Phytophthora lilii]